MASELEQLRQEAEQLKNQIRVRNRLFWIVLWYSEFVMICMLCVAIWLNANALLLMYELYMLLYVTYSGYHSDE